MSMPIWIFLLIEALIEVKCAPKLGHVLFDPLYYEAEKFDGIKALLKEWIPITHQQKSTSTQEETTSQSVPENNNTTISVNITSIKQNLTDSDKKITDFFKVFKNAWEGLKRQNNPLKSLRTYDIVTSKAETKEPCAEYEYNGKLCKIINNRLLCGYNKNKGELNQDDVVDMGNGCRVRNDRIECGYETGQWDKSLRRPPARDETHYETETLPYISDSASVLKLRTEEIIAIKGINTVISTFSDVKSIIANQILSTTQVSTESTTLLVTATEGKNEPTPEREKKRELLTTTEAVHDAVRELATTTEAGSTTELVTTTEQTIYSAPELKSTSPGQTRKNLVSSTIHASDSTDPTAQYIAKVENAASPTKITRVLRSIVEDKKIMTRRDTNIKPQRYCVEKGDRIVCYYTKNY